MLNNDKTRVFEPETPKTAPLQNATKLNTEKIALVSGGVVLAGGLGVAAHAYRNAQGEVVMPEKIETAKEEQITIQRDEEGKIIGMTVDENHDGIDDLRFENPQKINTTSPPAERELNTATKVNDEMSFSQAFAAARNEVGPGGVFVWHGQLYGTYYKEEWDAMTPEQKAEYGQKVNEYIAEHPLPEYQPTAADDVVLMGEVDIDGDGVIDGVAVDTNHNGVADAIVVDMNHNGVVDALIVNENEDDVIDAIYIDQNEDNIVDAIVDANGNPINQNELPTAYGNNQDFAANYDDFQDNADVSEWV
jgi:hypothetical protein